MHTIFESATSHTLSFLTQCINMIVMCFWRERRLSAAATQRKENPPYKPTAELLSRAEIRKW